MSILVKSSLISSVRSWVACLVCSAALAGAASAREKATGEFRIEKEGRPLLVGGSMRGKRIVFLVDTGASRTGFNIAMKSLLGEPLGTAHLDTVAGTTEVENFDCPDVSVGGLSVKSNRPVFCCNLQEVQAAVGHELSGILGMDILGQFVMRIDFDHGTLSLVNELPGDPEDCGTAFPMRFRSSVPHLNVQCGSVDQPFVIDTGSTGTCIDSNTFNALAKAKELHVGPQYYAMTPLGQRPAHIGLLERFSLGPFIHHELLCDEASMSILGLSYLSRYVVTLDFPNGVAYLCKGEQFAKDELRGTSGVVLEWVGGRLIVKRIRHEGPAAMAGIRTDDEIIAIHDEPASKLDLFRARQLLTSRPGRAVKLKLMRGGQIIEASVMVKDRLVP